MVGRAALRQSTVQIVDAWTDPDYGPKHEARLGGVRSMLAVPLVREGAPIGMFTVGRHAVDPFTPQQISLIGSFADQAVIAIENTRLIAELHQRTAESGGSARIPGRDQRNPARHQQLALRPGACLRRRSRKGDASLRRRRGVAVAV